MRPVVPALAVITAGLALYFTQSILDQVLVDGRTLRVALVPAWPTLVAFLVMMALAVWWLARLARPRAVTSVAVRLQVGALVLPVFALVLLIIPYFPLLPDWLPGLQILAGPLKWIVWLAAGGLLSWTLWQARVIRADWLARATVTQIAVGIAVVTAVISGGAAMRLAGTVMFPAGDEPHYLVMAQSLWRDGDLQIENNHDRGDYREYFHHDLKPDYLQRGVDKQIYSIHPVGLPVLMAPVYAAGGYFGVVAALILLASIAAATAWRFVVDATQAAGAATFAWASIALTTPFLYNTFTVYPEIVAALCVIVAFTRALQADAWPHGWARWLIVSLASASLPWLSTKYAPMSAALVLTALLRTDLRRAPLAAVIILLPYVASLTTWFSYFYRVWGTPLPSAPYGDLVQTSLSNTVFGAPGLLFDQEYGVLAYAPIYVLALSGLVSMFLAGAEMRRRAVETIVVFGALLITVGAFRIWWGGTASPGRPLASGLLLLALPIAVAAQSAPAGSARRAGHHLLLWISVGIAATLALAQQGLLINNGRDGTSTLLEYWSPTWSLWTLAPTFTFHEAPTAWLHSLTWLVIAFGAGWLLAHWRTRTAGAATLAAVTAFVGALLTAGAVMPLLPHSPPLPRADAAARWHLEMLDHFDNSERPVGIVFDPFRFTSAATLVPLASLGVAPGLRPAPEPLRVLHNGRFSLPAGRYRADVDWSSALPRAMPIGLQVGRIEPAWKTWNVQPAPGTRWAIDFDLPVSANFVGLRASNEVEQAIARIGITPLAVVDERVRAQVPIVLATWQFGSTTAMFHDELSSPEPAGFWVLGAATARVTLARAHDAEPLVLRVHSGSVPNRVTIGMRGWSETLTLDPKAPQDITLPDSTRPVVTIEVHPEAGFWPRDFDPNTFDRRYLGAWVEVMPPKAATP